LCLVAAGCRDLHAVMRVLVPVQLWGVS
jgi:hypothetical protein